MRTPAASPVVNPYRVASSKSKTVTFPESDLATVLDSSSTSRGGITASSSCGSVAEPSYNPKYESPGTPRSLGTSLLSGNSDSAVNTPGARVRVFNDLLHNSANNHGDKRRNVEHRPDSALSWSADPSRACPRSGDWTSSGNSSDEQVASLQKQNLSSVKLSTNSSLSSEPQTPSSFRGKGFLGYPKSPHPGGRKTPMSVQDPDGETTRLFSAILDRRDSAGTFFQNLRKENGYPEDCVHQQIPEDEFKEATESYFLQEEEFLRSKKLNAGNAKGLRPPSEIVTSSTERRYSAVVHQFMQKNGLITPQPDGTLLSRQADQARPSDPSYVSWAPVDQDHSPVMMNKENEAVNLSTFSGPDSRRIPELYTPGSVITQSEESFHLKSVFTPNAAVALPKTLRPLAEVENSASPFNYDNDGQNLLSHTNQLCHASQPTPTAAAADNDGSSCDSSSVTSSDRGGGGASSGAETESPQSPQKEKARKVGSAVLSFIPERVRESWRQNCSGSGRRNGSIRLTPLSPRRRQTLAISPDGSYETGSMKKATKLKMIGVILMSMGLSIILGSVIGLIVLLA